MAKQTRIKEIQRGNVGATVWDHGPAATPRRSVTFCRLYPVRGVPIGLSLSPQPGDGDTGSDQIEAGLRFRL